MSHRSHDDPIYLIRRIPPVDQLEAARPGTRSLGERLGRAATSLARLVAQRFTSSSRPQHAAGSREAPLSPYQGGPDDVLYDVMAETGVEAKREGVEQEGGEKVNEKGPTVIKEGRDGEQTSGIDGPAELASGPPLVHPEEVAELRAFLLQQQQDIVRLASQIQELRSLVSVQQRVIAQLIETLSPNTDSLRPDGSPGGQPQLGRQGRPKVSKTEKTAAARNETLWLPLNV